MAETLFMRVKEVAQELGVSESYAYKLVHELNEELKANNQGQSKWKYDYICPACPNGLVGHKSAD